MTRIIAGFAGSITITVPGRGTRPTSDRVREAIFSSLESRGGFAGARVVDLYAGSGALGLEAVSRGAESAALVEKNGAAAMACRRNAATVLRSAPRRAAGDTPTVDVRAAAVQSYLASPTAPAGAPWHIAFLDPPYDLSDDDLAKDLALLVPLLTAGAIVMVERSSRSTEPAWPDGLTLDRRSNYGDTTLWWASTAEVDDDE
ncbi:RsmD family RNA methyltransferase [Marisediminicola senii]|uniref:RsmD family RNA methyltransferase n=1 Tax=Marisediminicola senii TaxID=2711233 RepID=UPI0013EDBCE3|nr:RsmD family RNA methyltransferase [Marisediminicola senii]